MIQLHLIEITPTGPIYPDVDFYAVAEWGRVYEILELVNNAFKHLGSNFKLISEEDKLFTEIWDKINKEDALFTESYNKVKEEYEGLKK
jgi:hypothetical protein